MRSLAAEDLANDPRIAQAKALLRDALMTHQQAITGVRAANPERRATYQQTIDAFSKARGGNLFYPYIGSGIGRGALVELADGSVKYDFITGIGVHAMGHSSPALLDALIDAALADTVMQGNLQQNADSAALAQLILSLARGGAHTCRLAHCFLSTSGAMANENALKLAFHHRAPADRVLAFEHCFTGRTLALAQVTDKPAYRAGLPSTLNVDYVPFFDGADPKGSTQRALQAIDTHLTAHPERHACMVMELVQGEGGYNVGDRDFFLALMRRLRQHKVLVFVDEVQTFGRTSEPFAFQHFDLAPFVDIATIGKLSQVCATLFTDALVPKPGLVSQTFTGSTASIRAADVILRHLNDGGFFGRRGRNMKLHEHVVGRLEQIRDRHASVIQGPWGVGGMVAMTFLDGDAAKTRRLLDALFDAGVIAFVCGSEPSRIRFLMPLGCVTEADIDAVCAILERVVVQQAQAIRAAEAGG